MLRKIEEQKFKQSTSEWQREQEYNVRRKRRKALQKKMDAKTKLSIVRKLGIASLVCSFLGVVVVFGACVRSIGEGTFLYTYREYFRIVGVVVLVGGLVWMLVTIAMETNILKEMTEAGELNIDMGKCLIHQDFLNEARLGKMRAYNKQDSYDEDSFLGSSIRSTPGDFAGRLSQSNHSATDMDKRLTHAGVLKEGRPGKIPAYTKQVSFDEDSLLGSSIQSTSGDFVARFSKYNQPDRHEKRRLLSANDAVENDAMADLRHGGIRRGAGVVPEVKVTMHEETEKALGIPQITYAHTCNASLKCPCKGNADRVPFGNPCQCDQKLSNGINPSSAIYEQLSGDILKKLSNQKAVDV